MRVVDLFAGVGGLSFGFTMANFETVFAIEHDESIANTYKLNHPNTDVFSTDIEKLNLKDLTKKYKNIDVVVGGPPCQGFSQKGKRLSLDDERNYLFRYFIEFVKAFKPKYFLLENVPNITTTSNGFFKNEIICAFNDLGYEVDVDILTASDFGVPQNRERTIIIGALNGVKFDFKKLKKSKPTFIKDILEENVDFEYLNEEEYTLIENPKKQPSGLIFCGYRNKKIRSVGVRENTEHLSRVHKQPNRIYSSNGVHPTIASQESSGRYFIYHKNRVRKLTIKECFRLMGFSDNFKIIGSKTNIYNRIGNSVVIPMIKEIAKEIENQILNKKTEIKKEYIPKSLFDNEYLNLSLDRRVYK